MLDILHTDQVQPTQQVAMQNVLLFHAATHSSSVSKRFFNRPGLRFFLLLLLLLLSLARFNPLGLAYICFGYSSTTREHQFMLFGRDEVKGFIFFPHFFEVALICYGGSPQACYKRSSTR